MRWYTQSRIEYEQHEKPLDMFVFWPKAHSHELVTKARTHTYDLSELRDAIPSITGPKVTSFD
jgi:hypothetical protein